MIKRLLKITGIILANLFAFLLVGHILDVIFSQKYIFKLTFILLSILPLVFLITYNIRKK